MSKPRIKRQLKVDLGSFTLTIDQPKEIYKKPDTLCKITVANIRETKARRKVRHMEKILIPAINKLFGKDLFNYHY